MREGNTKKRPIGLDWQNILDVDGVGGGGEPPELLILKKPPTEPPPPTADDTARQSLEEEYKQLPDRDVEAKIERMREMLGIGSIRDKLPDKGKKLRVSVEVLEAERERRKLLRARKAVDECQKMTRTTCAEVIDDSDDFVRDNPPSHVRVESQFSSIFSKKLDENTDCAVVNGFDKEFSALGHCKDQKENQNTGISEGGRQKAESSSRSSPFQPASSLSRGRHGEGHAGGDKIGRVYYTRSSHQKDVRSLSMSNGLHPKRGETLVLIDEDETQFAEATEQESELSKRLKDATIYYPSRDDPESVEIHFKDMDCLAPEAFLTSPIMNFYIRYLELQASATKKAICNYHFFNTFFYYKLEQAVGHKGNDKEPLFIKLRRWWKGVNIFQKAYVLIPIHEDLHWSLVIICMPHEEDESGPIILHLDSLRLHNSKSVFKSIKSFLSEEWRFINQKGTPSDHLISDRMWSCLPDRIEEKVIKVPQQKNDYDCGLFVLYFMERFIEEAPERLKRMDLSMVLFFFLVHPFSVPSLHLINCNDRHILLTYYKLQFFKRWFRPEEASELRVKIRNLLRENFQQANEDYESSPGPSDGSAPT